jgi:hypothetical protein
MLDMTPEIRKLILWARMIHITGLLMIFSSFNSIKTYLSCHTCCHMITLQSIKVGSSFICLDIMFVL